MLPPLRHISPQLSGRVPAALKFLTPHSGLLVCGIFLLAGWFLAGDYTAGVDLGYQIILTQANWDYIRGRADMVDTIPYFEQVYGVAFDLPLLLLTEQIPGSADYPDTYRLRFFLTHLLFIVSGYFCYRLAWQLFNNRWLALAALLFFLLHPRLYAHSYINSKDLPFLSMLMIALYLLERAFRRDTWGAFILLGIGVGLLTNLRIMGIMLFAATLAMRGLDLFYAGSWAQRRGVLLTAGLFILTAGLTVYALSPFAWTNPIDYLLISLAIAAEHPVVGAQLFQGERVLSDELPPQYTAVWFGITTPPLALLLGGLGAAGTVAAGLRRPAAVFRNTRLRFVLLLLACFLLPPLAATLLGSVQLDNWRHLYFIYAPFGLLAVGGLHWICSSLAPSRKFAWPVLRTGAYGLAGAGLGLIVLQMTQIHPLQDIYFNFLVDRTTPEYLRTRYDMASLSLKQRPVREYLLERHPGEDVTVREGYRDLTPVKSRPGLIAGADQEADYALFYVWDDGHQDLAFNSLPAGRIYNNTLVAAKPLKDSRMTAAAVAAYREHYRQALAGEPIIRAAYDVYRHGRTLTFIRENCQLSDRARQVYVKVLLPDLATPTGNAILFPSHGVRLEDTCLAVIQLPDYAQGDLIIGQHWSDDHRWAELYSLAQPGLGERIATARRKNRQPALREVFDVFLEQEADGRQRLLYAKADCSPGDYGTLVFLHIYPADAADLPPYIDVQRTGAAVQDFALYHYGGWVGGECVAVVPLPDYPGGIKEIRTGQPERWGGSLYPPAEPGPLRRAYAALAAVPPDLQSDFDLYWREGQLTYIRESCAAADTGAPFFLHIFPADDDLLAGPAVNMDNLDFDFGRWGGHFDGKCLAAAPLPDYPIAALRTGQYVPEQGSIWSVDLIAPANPGPLRAAYAARADGQLLARDAFDLYDLDDRLLYLRESCAPADTAAPFYLYAIPEDPADLPEQWRADGAAWLGFGWAHRGGHFDGKCLAVIPLPDFPIKEMHTGQYIPDQGDVWSVQLIAPADPEELRADYAALSAERPAARDYFDLYAPDNRLIYLRESCTAADMAAPFFLHIVPEEVTDLTEERRAAGFAYGDFEFVRQGGQFDGKCLAAVSLPDYPVKELRTGQYVPGQGPPLWSVELIAPANPDELRGIYAALSAANPVARNYFDLYLRDNRLIYLRESCAAADTAAPFFLQIVPEKMSDLPEEWRAGGLAYGDFEFVRQGGHFDGKCLAAVSLPDYPIKEIRTGQHIPGQGPLWLAELIAAADPDKLRGIYAAISAAEPVARSYFDLYRQDNRLIYLRESCAAADTAAKFFLHIIPEKVSDLPEEQQADGSAYRDFDFVRQGGHFDGKCLAVVPLPDYPIKEIRTGQHIPGQGHLWLAELIAAADPDKLRADYAALAAAEPVARNYFDLYRQENRLIYLRENCAAADTAAPFFLQIVPEEVSDLPEEWRAGGLAYGDFDFVRQGGHFDGKCLAVAPLPDYPIKEIWTGQHIPGQGPLWLVELISPADPDKLRAIYAALSAAEPVARNYFDLYRRGNRLIYLRESCAAADTAAPFFLQIVPEKVSDLPEKWRAGGRAYGDFDFVRAGGHFDGKCLAAVSLPDYPVKEIWTGQHIPGQGAPLWLVELVVAR